MNGNIAVQTNIAHILFLVKPAIGKFGQGIPQIYFQLHDKEFNMHTLQKCDKRRHCIHVHNICEGLIFTNLLNWYENQAKAEK